MPGDYYCKMNGRLLGPVTAKHLRYLAYFGRLAEEDLVRKAGAEEWLQANSFAGLFDDDGEEPEPDDDDGSGIYPPPPPAAATRESAALEPTEPDGPALPPPALPQTKSNWRGEDRSGKPPALLFVLMAAAVLGLGFVLYAAISGDQKREAPAPEKAPPPSKHAAR